MKVEVFTHPSGIAIYTVRTAGGEFELSSFGGQLLSWTKLDVPILFANREAAIVDGKTAYRGGAPICFPYFSKGLLLPDKTLIEPQHGRARNSVWEVEIDEEAQTLLFRTQQPSGDGYGPTTFRCEIAYVFKDDLEIHAQITNLGEHPAPFQFVVHSYWATKQPAQAEVAGLGPRFLDNLEALAERMDPHPDQAHPQPFDRVYPDSADHLEVATESYRLSIVTEGGAGTVLWNPGENHPIKDLKAPDFICVESGIITPAPILEPGQETRMRISYRAEVPA